MMQNILWTGGAALIASLGIVAIAQFWAQRQRLLDHPNERSLHERPTPRGGGIGIVVPVCFAIAGVGLLEPCTRPASTWLAGLGFLIAAVGFVDDVRGLAAGSRLATHALVAVLVVAFLGSWESVTWPGLHPVDLGRAAAPLTVIFVVGLTNAYNFMDGSDGMAGGQGLVAGLGWTGVGLATQDSLVAVTGVVVALGSFGFLVFNWSPARIFMGDVGSAFLGFVLSALCVYVSSRSPETATAGVLFVWPFIFDTGLTFVRRARRRENLLCAHRTHLYQRLVLTGVSHRTVAMLYGALAMVGVAVGSAVARGLTTESAVGALVIAMLAGGLWAGVVWRERNTRPDPANQAEEGVR